MTITYTLYNVFGILLSLNICSHFVINGGKESRGIKWGAFGVTYWDYSVAMQSVSMSRNYSVNKNQVISVASFPSVMWLPQFDALCFVTH